MSIESETIPEAVPETAKQAGEARPFDWVERSIWTDRMLEALVKGVKGGVWFSLIDKVYRPTTLQAAWQAVRRNKGSAGTDHESVERFEQRLEENIAGLEEELRTGTYRPRPIKRVYIDKLGSNEKRPLGVPVVRDRVVQTAIRLVIEPIFETKFKSHSYGFRPNRGSKDALREVDGFLKAGYTYVVDATLPGQGFDFLGYHFERGTRWPRKKSLRKLKDAIRAQTGRSNGTSLSAITANVNLTLKGWFEYFKHSHKWTFPALDGWIRRRLRSILRKRSKGSKGISGKIDHLRWPNKFFREHGLFNLVDAHMKLLQSSMR